MDPQQQVLSCIESLTYDPRQLGKHQITSIQTPLTKLLGQLKNQFVDSTLKKEITQHDVKIEKQQSTCFVGDQRGQSFYEFYKNTIEQNKPKPVVEEPNNNHLDQRNFIEDRHYGGFQENRQVFSSTDRPEMRYKVTKNVNENKQNQKQLNTQETHHLQQKIQKNIKQISHNQQEKQQKSLENQPQEQQNIRQNEAEKEKQMANEWNQITEKSKALREKKFQMLEWSMTEK